MGHFIEVEGNACLLKRLLIKIELALLMLVTSDMGMDFADVVLTTGSLANVLLWTQQTFQIKLCLSTFVVYPVDA